MSLKGNTSADKILRGRIERLDTLVISAYGIAVKNGFKGTEEEWLASIKGEPGHTPVVGEDYYTEEDRQLIISDVLRLLNESATARIGQVTLLASAWVGSEHLYSQVVTIDDVTERTQVDLTPDVNQLAAFYDKDLTFVTENVGGIVTVYAIGQKPMNDYTIQVTLTEVLA